MLAVSSSGTRGQGQGSMACNRRFAKIWPGTQTSGNGARGPLGHWLMLRANTIEGGGHNAGAGPSRTADRQDLRVAQARRTVMKAVDGRLDERRARAGIPVKSVARRARCAPSLIKVNNHHEVGLDIAR